MLVSQDWCGARFPFKHEVDRKSCLRIPLGAMLRVPISFQTLFFWDPPSRLKTLISMGSHSASGALTAAACSHRFPPKASEGNGCERTVRQETCSEAYSGQGENFVQPWALRKSDERHASIRALNREVCDLQETEQGTAAPCRLDCRTGAPHESQSF